MAAERRGEERVAADSGIRVRFRTPQDGQSQHYYLRDISRGGMFIATRNLQPIGTIVSLLVQFAEGDEVCLEARVAHVRTPAQIKPGLPSGIGVEFISVLPEVTKRLEALVGRLATASRPPRTTRPAPDSDAQEELELLRRLCWVLARGSFVDRPLEEVLGVPSEAPRQARRDMFRRLRSALGLDRPPAFMASDDRWEVERKLRMIETIVDSAGG